MTRLLALKHAPNLVFRAILAAIMPFMSARNKHAEFTNEKIKVRLSDDSDRRDFITPIMKCVRTRPPNSDAVKDRSSFY